MKYHKFHLVNPSPWPFLTPLWLFIVVVRFLEYAYCGESSMLSIFFLDQITQSIVFLLVILFFWARDVIREATFEGHHTTSVQSGLRLGFVLFIISEIMFFFSFFFAYFYNSSCPSCLIGLQWPPYLINVVQPQMLPFLNTFILLYSGLTITLCHIFIIKGDSTSSLSLLLFTIVLGLYFTFLQYCEYKASSFSINDGFFGSIFYVLTGFHGFHVLIGTFLLFLCFLRFLFLHFTKQHHLGFFCSAWYWHFVDVVWIFLYIFLYFFPYVEQEFYSTVFLVN